MLPVVHAPLHQLRRLVARPIGRALTLLLLMMLCQGGVRFEVHAHAIGESAASQHDAHAHEHEHDFEQPHQDGLHHHVHELGTVSVVLTLHRSVQLVALRSAVLRVAELAMPSSTSSAPPIRPPIVG